MRTTLRLYFKSILSQQSCHKHTHTAGMFIGLVTKGFSWTNITKMMADLIEFMIKCFPLQEEWEITYGEFE